MSTLRAGGISQPPFDDGQGGGGFNLATHVGDQITDVQENRHRLRALLPAEPAWLTQVHGTTVRDAGSVVAAPEADASFTNQPNVVCVIMTADCLPVLLCDRAGTVVGAAHAGWRGLADGVLQATVAAMQAAGANDLQAWLGPAIGPQQFEVGEEVRATFVARDANTAAAFLPYPNRSGKFLADIYLLARLALRDAGVSRIAGGDRCTVTEPTNFYSFRRDHRTGRMASLIWIE